MTTDPWGHAPLRDLADELLLEAGLEPEQATAIGRVLVDVLPQELGELLGALEAVFAPLVLEAPTEGLEAGGTLVLAAAVPLEPHQARAIARWFHRLTTARAEYEGDDGIGNAIARRLRARGLVRLEVTP